MFIELETNSLTSERKYIIKTKHLNNYSDVEIRQLICKL